MGARKCAAPNRRSIAVVDLLSVLVRFSEALSILECAMRLPKAGEIGEQDATRNGTDDEEACQCLGLALPIARVVQYLSTCRVGLVRAFPPTRRSGEPLLMCLKPMRQLAVAAAFLPALLCTEAGANSHLGKFLVAQHYECRLTRRMPQRARERR